MLSCPAAAWLSGAFPVRPRRHGTGGSQSDNGRRTWPSSGVYLQVTRIFAVANLTTFCIEWPRGRSCLSSGRFAFTLDEPEDVSLGARNKAALSVARPDVAQEPAA